MKARSEPAAQTTDRPLLGVSACLLGREVRYDGGHKHDSFLTKTAAKFFCFVAVCPEVEAGLGTPREAIRLERDRDGVRVLGRTSRTDVTGKLSDVVSTRLEALAGQELRGFVLKKDSPTCGLFRVRVHGGKGPPERDGVGVFARRLAERLPLLPLEEEGRLRDADLRDHFFERVFAYDRLCRLFAGRWTLGRLVAFHSAEKLLLFAHHEPGYRALGRLVARVKDLPRAELAERYRTGFMEVLSRPASRGQHVNVLQHMAGYVKHLPQAEKAELAQAIDDYRRELVPRLVPLTLLRHHVRREGVEYLAGQSYLDPFPRELALL